MFTTSMIRKSYTKLTATRRVVQNACRMFSGETTETVEDLKKEFPEPTEEEKLSYREQWGLKFDDECIKFEKEWEQIAKDRDEQQMKVLTEELDEESQRKVKFLVDKILTLNLFEMRYFGALTKDRVQKSTGINPLKLNMDWPSIKQEEDGTWPPLNPNWFKQQELMAKVGPFMASMGMTGGAPAAGAQAAEGGEDAGGTEEAKPEKTNLDIELTGFDAKAKIKIIKEVRGLLGLGLKEAKEMVESVPAWLKKDVKKEEAEEITKKLEDLGAQVRLV